MMAEIFKKKSKFDIYSKSYGNIRVEYWLGQHDIPYIREKTFDGLNGDKAALRIDFYLPLQNVCIEVDGGQHYKGSQENKEQFLKQRRYDRLKETYLFDHNIRLIRIVYDELSDLDNILNFLVDGKEEVIEGYVSHENEEEGFEYE